MELKEIPWRVPGLADSTCPIPTSLRRLPGKAKVTSWGQGACTTPSPQTALLLS